jgi:hypothetical protein
MPVSRMTWQVDDWNGVYDVNTFLDNLPAYNNPGQLELLDLLRVINESGNYYWVGQTFPHGSNIVVPGNATVNGSIPLPAGTFVTAISGYMDDGSVPGVASSPGFMMKIYDKGTKANLVYGNYILDRLVASNMQLQEGIGASDNEMFGPGYLLSPFVVSPPGLLMWEIVNLSASQATIQVLLDCAVPIRGDTRGVRVVTKG